MSKSIYNNIGNRSASKSLYYLTEAQEDAVNQTSASTGQVINFISNVQGATTIINQAIQPPAPAPAPTTAQTQQVSNQVNTNQLNIGSYFNYGSFYMVNQDNLAIYNEDSSTVKHERFTLLGIDNTIEGSTSSIVFHCKYQDSAYDNTTAYDTEIDFHDSKIRITGPSTFIESEKTSIADGVLTVGYVNRYNLTNRVELGLTYSDTDSEGHSKGVDFEYIDSNAVKLGFMGFNFARDRFIFYKDAKYQNHGTETEDQNFINRTSGAANNKFDLDDIYTNNIITADNTTSTSLAISASNDLTISSADHTFFGSNKGIYLMTGDNTPVSQNTFSTVLSLYGTNNEGTPKVVGAEIGYNADDVTTDDSIFRIMYDSSEVLRIDSGSMYAAGSFDIGTTSNKITNLYATTVNADSVVMSGNLDMSGGNYDITIPDNSAVAMEIKEGVTSYMIFNTVNGSEEIFFGIPINVTGGTIDGTVIGGTTKAAGTFTSLTADSLTAPLDLDGETIDGAILTTPTITGGTIDNTTIGTTTPAAGMFTLLTTDTLTLNGDLVMTSGTYDISIKENESESLDIRAGATSYLKFSTLTGSEELIMGVPITVTSGNVDGTIIGGSTPAAGSFTTLTADSLDLSAAATEITIKDNEFLAFAVKDTTGDSYFTCVSLTGNESTVFNKDVSIGGGIINDTEIGGSGAAAGTFTTATADSVVVNSDIDFSGGASKTILLIDNATPALEIKEGSNNYMRFLTTNNDERIIMSKKVRFIDNLDLTYGAKQFIIGDSKTNGLTIQTGTDEDGDVDEYMKVITSVGQEKVRFYKDVKIDGEILLNFSASAIDLAANEAAALVIKEDTTTYMTFKTTTGINEVIFDSGVDVVIESGGIDGTVIGSNTPLSGTFTTITGDDMTLNGDITLSTGIGIVMPDNAIPGLEIKEGTNNYMRFVTQDGNERISVHQKLKMQADFDLTFGPVSMVLSDERAAALDITDESSNSFIYFNTVTGSQKTVFTYDVDINGGAIDGTVIGATTKAAGTFTTLTVDNLVGSFSLDNQSFDNPTITNGTMNGTVIGGTTPAAGTFTALTGTSIDLDGNLDMATGAYDILIKDNEATALEIKEGTTAYLTFVTTDGSEQIVFGQNIEVTGGTIDGTTIGNTTPASAIFTFLGANALTLNGNMVLTSGAYDMVIKDNEAEAFTIRNDTDDYLNFVTTNGSEKVVIGMPIEVTGGTIDGTVIGATTKAAGTFTTLTADTLVATINLDNQSMDNPTITNGTINGTSVGATTPAAGSFTLLTTDTFALNGDIVMTTGAYDISIKENELESLDIRAGATSYLKFSTLTGSEGITLGAPVTITGGTIDGTVIGGTTKAAGTFTTLTADNLIATIDLDNQSMDNPTITNGTMNGTIIGGSNAAAGTFTTLTATTLGGNLNGNNNTIDMINITNGSINGTVIGASNAANGTFMELTANSLGGNLNGNNNTIDMININNGAINNTTIGATNSANGTFMQLECNEFTVNQNIDVTNSATNVSMKDNTMHAYAWVESGQHYIYANTTDGAEKVVIEKDVEIKGGTINNTAVGDMNPSTGNFTTLSINNTAITATANEINGISVSANTETITGTGNITSSSVMVALEAAGTDYAVNLNPPGSDQRGKTMVIQLTQPGVGKVTVNAGSLLNSAFNTYDFTSVNETMILVGTWNSWYLVSATATGV